MARPLTVQRVAILLLGVLSQRRVETLIWLWEQRGIVEWAGDDLVWSEAQRQKGGTIRW